MKRLLALLVCFSLFCSCTPYNSSKSEETSQSVFDPSTLKEFSDLVLSSNMFSDLIEGQYREPFKATGTYDLNFDGKEDRINLDLRPRSIDASSVIQVNNLALKLDLSTPLKAYLIDLDSKDKYIEIAVLDDGPSFDPCYYFFRYDGTNVIQLGNCSTDYLYDGNGRIFSAIRWMSPQIVTVVYEVYANKIKEIDFDISDAMDKEYTVSSNIDGYFIEMELVPTDFSPSWEAKEMEKNKIILSENDKIVIKNMLGYDEFFVQLSSGKTGVLYFWIGD